MLATEKVIGVVIGSWFAVGIVGIVVCYYFRKEIKRQWRRRQRVKAEQIELAARNEGTV